MAPDPRGRRFRGVAGTVRFRVTALATVAVVAVLIAAGVGLVLAQQRLLTQNLDESIGLDLDSIEAAVRAGDLPTVLRGFGDDDTVAQVVTPEGEVVAATPNVRGRSPIVEEVPGDRPRLVRDIDHLPSDAGSFRLHSRRVDSSDGPVVIHVAATLSDIRESTSILVRSLTIAIPGVAALLAVLVWVLVGRTLRPVEAIRSEVADISGSDLHRRVPDPGGADEIARLARTMNGMLDRVETSVQRQQRFVADASHELRSPLTRIRSELEVDLAHPDRADAWATHRSVLEEAKGLQQLVEDLLHLARSDSATTTLRTDLIDLDDIVLNAARALRADGVSVDSTGVQTAQIRGDAPQLARAVGNLADNAARHAASRVTFTLTERGGEAEVTVADDGPGIPPDQHEQVFGRFIRLDEARQGSIGGTGLGLAIARDIVVRHGGTLRVDADRRPGACFVLRVPLASDAA